MAKFGPALRELRIHLCQKSATSFGVRDWIDHHYLSNRPQKFSSRFTLPVLLIREFSVVSSRIYAGAKGRENGNNGSSTKKRASEITNTIQKYGLDPETMQQFTDLNLMSPNAVENYILILKEVGFKEVKPHLIINYRIISKQSIDVLKAANLIPKDRDVVQTYCRQLDMTETTEKEMRLALPSDYEQIPLAEVRLIVLIYFLKGAFNCDLDAANKMVKTYPRFKNRSYQWIKDNLSILLEKLKFPHEKIRKHSYLLLTNPSNSLEILEKLPNLGGRSIIEVVQLRPKIIMSQLSTLLEITQLFEQHGIQTTAIAKYPEVYTLSPSTIRSRLEEFDRIPEFEVLKDHPRVGRLIYYQNKIKKRLEYLQTSHQIFNSSLHILSTDTEHFENFLKLGDMRTKGVDNVQFVATYLNLPKVEVRRQLMLQPNWREISSVTTRSVLNYLTKTKAFNVDQLKHSLQIVLYPLDKVMSSVRMVTENGESAETDLWFLQMVLYYIEKKCHFSGAGVWNNETSRVGNNGNGSVKNATTQDSENKDKDLICEDLLHADSLVGNSNVNTIMVGDDEIRVHEDEDFEHFDDVGEIEIECKPEHLVIDDLNLRL